jgi:hypothetical protein
MRIKHTFKVGDVVRCRQNHIHVILELYPTLTGEYIVLPNCTYIKGGASVTLCEKMDAPVLLASRLEILLYGV